MGYNRNTCLLCCPSVAAQIEINGGVTNAYKLLEFDERFSKARNFIKWNLYRPTAVGEIFDLIMCDPPFDKVSVSQLYKAFRTLGAFGRNGPRVLIVFPERHESSLLATFAEIELRRAPNEWHELIYISVSKKKIKKSGFHIYVNFDVN